MADFCKPGGEGELLQDVAQTLEARGRQALCMGTSEMDSTTDLGSKSVRLYTGGSYRHAPRLGEREQRAGDLRHGRYKLFASDRRAEQWRDVLGWQFRHLALRL